MKKKLALLTLFFSTANALSTDSLGDLSDKLMLPLSYLTAGLYDISIAIGIALLFGSFIQYRNHKKNPGQVPLGRPVALFIFGALLIALPLLAKFSASASLVAREY